MQTIYDQLEKLAGPIVKHFREDLTEIDREWIENKMPGVPFIHASRDTGTYILFLEQPEQLPRPGKPIPYLFGYADGPTILDGHVKCCESVTSPYSLPSQLYLYFDGKRLKEITPEKFVELAKEWRRRCHAFWSAERRAVAS